MAKTIKPSPAREWSPTDYLLDGQHCESHVLANLFGRFREKCGAARGMLLVTVDNTLMSSILTVSDACAGIGAQIQQNVIHVISQQAPGVAVLKPIFDGSINCRVPELLTNYNQLAYFLRPAATAIKPTGHAASVNLLPPERENRRVKIGALMLYDSKRNCRRFSQAVAANVAIAALSTAPVAFHRNWDERQLINSHFHELQAKARDRRNQESLDDNRSSQLGPDPQSLDDLLKLCKDFSHADFAMVLLRLPNGEFRSHPQSDATEIWSHPAFLHCASRGKPYLYNDLQGQVLAQEFFVKQTGKPLAATALVPIGDAGEGAPVGVVFLAKLANSTRPRFHMTDVQAAWVLASRFAASLSKQHADSMLSSVAKILSGRSPVPSCATVDVDGLMSTDSAPTRVPFEFLTFPGPIANWLESALLLTESNSITLRLLSVDGESLVRTYAVPSDVINEPNGVLPLRDRTIQAYVAEFGREVLLYDTSGDKTLRRLEKAGYRYLNVRNSRSEAAFPVFVQGRLVGTINLESSRRGAYEPFHAYLSALVSAISLQLASVRQETLVDALDISARLLRSWHAINHACEFAQNVCDKMVPGSAEFTDWSEILRLIGTIDFEARNSESCEMVDLIEEYFRPPGWMIQTTDLDGKRLARGRFSVPLELRSNIAVCLDTLKDNCVRHGGEPKALIQCSDVFLGGKKVVRMRFKNRAEDLCRLPRSFARLYRMPIEVDLSRNRIGCFIVGLIMRRIGGDANAMLCGEQIVTQLEFPGGSNE